MKNYLIMYDISNNKVRQRTVKVLKKNGFHRIQKSVFAGACTNKNLDSIIAHFTALSKHPKNANDSYIIIPLPDYIVEQITEINRQTDFTLYCGKKTVHFF